MKREEETGKAAEDSARTSPWVDAASDTDGGRLRAGGGYRIFSVMMASAASRMVQIQKRTVIFDSCHAPRGHWNT